MVVVAWFDYPFPAVAAIVIFCIFALGICYVFDDEGG
jgi:hypothetical protein